MTAMFLIALAPLAVLMTQYFGNVERFGNKAAVLAVAMICIGAAAHQAWSANLFTTVSDMFPKKTVASVTGIGTTAGGVGGGVILQMLAGRLTDALQTNAANRLPHHVHHLRPELSDRVGHDEGAGAPAQTHHGLVKTSV